MKVLPDLQFRARPTLGSDHIEQLLELHEKEDVRIADPFTKAARRLGRHDVALT
jgi:hypothetical protein